MKGLQHIRPSSIISISSIALLMLPTLLFAQEETAENRFLANLAEYLGLSSHQELLHQGEVVHTALLADEQLPEEIVVVGAMLLVKGVAPDEVINAFMHDEIFKEVYNVERYQAVSSADTTTYTFAQLSLDPELSNARTYRNPNREFNLSTQEAESLQAIDSPGEQGVLAAENVWRQLLENRLDSFIDNGVSGIEAYVRPGGKDLSPAQEISAAIEASAFLADEFPGFLPTLLAPAETSTSEFEQQYFWLETEFDDKNVWSLDTELRQLQQDSALAADLHFYATRGYYSMLTFIGVVPYEEHSLVFAINHTYTDAILGFATKLKRRIGRKRLAASLSQHLSLVRSQLEN